MNIKVRLKNKTFWLTAIPATITFVYTILSLFDIVPSISEAVLIKIATMIISALSVLGVLVDPTTAGIKDSKRAMTYKSPFKDIKSILSKKVEGDEDDLK